MQQEKSRASPDARARWRRALVRDESGQVLVLMGLAMLMILGVAAFALDLAQLSVAHHQAQVAADAGALAAAQDMENVNTPSSTVIADGAKVAGDNDQGATVTISQPGGSTGTTAKAVVAASVKLPFGTMFGFGSGSVSAQAVAQVSSTPSTVGDSDITDLGCGTNEQICTFYAGGTVPDSNDGSAGDWIVTGNAEDPTTAFNPVTGEAASDDPQCGGGNENGGPGNGNHGNGGGTYDCDASEDGESTVNRQPCNGGTTAALCFAPNSSQSSLFEVMDLNGQTEGGMYQTVTTVPGDRYVLSFWLAGNPGVQGYPSPSSNSFPVDVYITNNVNGTAGTPYTPTYSGLDACTGAAGSQPTYVITCGYWDPSDEDVAGEEDANFQVYTLPFTATSSSTTITFNSETYDADAYDSAEGDYWFFCGPEVTNIDLAYAGLQLVQ